MANIIVVSGPQAVGKMTVAEKLRDKTGYRLMTNHDSIELSDVIFERTSDAQKEFNLLIRKAAFETAIKYDIDMIFTLVMAYDEEKDLAYINYLKTLFESTGGKFYFVELSASLETRLKRNITPHRLEMKPTKRDTEWTKHDILKTMEKYRLNSYEDEYLCEQHLKINNDNLLPEEVADIIIKEFNLAVVKGK
ncbi:MAG: AAA family ATPase [Bacilli bacterium]|nr:AAA family ATPase [Bacilli bacterium]